MKNTLLFIIILLNVRCTNPKKDLEYLICNDDIQYWNYEWPHKRSEYFGFTFSFDKNGKVLKYSYRKESNTRKLFEDSHIPGYGNWKVTKDSILTFMNSQLKIVSYSKNTIQCVDYDIRNIIRFIRVSKDDLNIVTE